MLNKDELLKRVKNLGRKRSAIDFDVKEFIEDSQLISQMYGNPYFEEGESWPTNPETENPLMFIFQIVNSENIQLDNDISIIQFYYDMEAQPWENDEEGWLVKVYNKISEEKIICLQKPEIKKLADHDPLTALLTFKDELSFPQYGDLFFLDRDLQKTLSDIESSEGIDNFEHYDELCYKAGGESIPACSGVGGYPSWWQEGVVIKNGQGEFYNLLLEINNGILWNRFAGIFLFVNPRDKKDIKFVFQCT